VEHDDKELAIPALTPSLIKPTDAATNKTYLALQKAWATDGKLDTAKVDQALKDHLSSTDYKYLAKYLEV
jgi:hypothetical protein